MELINIRIVDMTFGYETGTSCLCVSPFTKVRSFLPQLSSNLLR